MSYCLFWYFISLYGWIVFYYTDMPHIVCTFISWWTVKLFPSFSYLWVEPSLVHFNVLVREHCAPGGWSNRNLFFIVLGTGKSKLKVLTDLLSGQVHLLVYIVVFWLGLRVAQSGSKLSLNSYKDMSGTHKTFTFVISSNSNHFPKTC